MKVKNLFLGSLACLAFAACSNDDDTVVNPSAEGSEKFVVVSISVPPTRALSETDFEEGTATENTVSNALLVFFDESGNYFQAQQPTLAWGDGATEINPALEKTAEAVVVFKNTTDIPRSVVAILNSTLTVGQLDSDKPSLTELKGIDYIADYSSESSFVMTSSVYKETDDASNVICEAIITTDNIAKKAAGDGEPTEAEKNAATPVQIYVERVLAKVKVSTEAVGSFSNAGTTVDIKGVDANGSITTVEDNLTIIPEITGWHLAYTNPKSNLLKKVETGASTTWGYAGEGWTDVQNKRSYWGISYEPTGGDKWGFSKYSESTKGVHYCLENTTDLTESTTATKLVVTAVLKDGEGNVIGDLVKHNGWYYKEEDFLKLAAQSLVTAGFKYSIDGGAATSDWLNYLKTQRYSKSGEEEQWLVEAALKTTVPASPLVMTITKNDVASDANEVNEYLQETVGSAQEWQDGKCYYFVNINHINQKNAIIRNHVYDVLISGIVGLGTPVYDPDTDEDGTPEEEEIIPEKPTDDASFVMAQVNILKWRVVAQQSVTLQ
ncbi:MAG: Mfa1 family fimbria major subunit [Bacteroidaceae bacterium]|nr:Mfa1 family fimbria major subunit [Bacteroidaceae bacterium]